MGEHDYYLLLAHYYRKYFSKHVAILVILKQQQPYQIVSWALDGYHNQYAGETACVNVMRAQAEKGFEAADYFLYSTQTPTPMCLGMALRCHVTRIYYNFNRCFGYSTPNDVFARIPRDLTQTDVSNAIAEYRFDHYIRDIAKQGDLKAMPQSRLSMLKCKEFPLPRSFARLKSVNFSNTALNDKLYMTLTLALLNVFPRQIDSHGQQIAAILVSPNGNLLSWGVNTNEKNVTNHAEVNCILSYFAIEREPVPDNCTLYTSLQSCEMCAGMLTTVAKNLRVVYASKDNGVLTTSLKRKHNGCFEVFYGISQSNPLARTKFKHLVNKQIQKNREINYNSQVRVVKKAVSNSFSEKRVKEMQQAEEQSAKKDIGIKYKELVEKTVTEFMQRYPNKAYKIRSLPEAITTLLKHGYAYESYRNYHSIYTQLGLAMIAVNQYRPGKDFMGFTRLELKKIVEKHLISFPMLHGMSEQQLVSYIELHDCGLNLLNKLKSQGSDIIVIHDSLDYKSDY